MQIFIKNIVRAVVEISNIMVALIRFTSNMPFGRVVVNSVTVPFGRAIVRMYTSLPSGKLHYSGLPTTGVILADAHNLLKY